MLFEFFINKYFLFFESFTREITCYFISINKLVILIIVIDRNLIPYWISYLRHTRIDIKCIFRHPLILLWFFPIRKINHFHVSLLFNY